MHGHCLHGRSSMLRQEKKKIMSSTLKRPVSTTTFFRKTRFGQVNYVEGGSLKRILLLDGQLKHIHTLA
jgi:hypothetical protein